MLLRDETERGARDLGRGDPRETGCAGWPGLRVTSAAAQGARSLPGQESLRRLRSGFDYPETLRKQLLRGIDPVEANDRVAEPEPLSRLAAGKWAVVHSLQGGHEFRSRVANLGFVAGTPISVRQNYGHGPILVALRGTLVALGRAEAAKVMVRSGE